jgi:ferredoxin
MEFTRRRAQNACGLFYVTEECIGCGLCAAYAADNLKWNREGTRCYVACQPRDGRERDAVWDAVADCPVAALSATATDPEIAGGPS